MDKHASNFIKLIKTKAKAVDITVRLGKGNRVNCDGRRTNGYCSTDELVVATGKPFYDWFSTFVHEASHMEQYIEDSPYWDAATDDDYDIMEAYLNGVGNDRIVEVLDHVVQLEADCEARTYNNIKEYDLPIDLDHYAQRANAYLYFHKVMLMKKKWYVTAPYEQEDLISQMPKKILAPKDYKMNRVDVDITLFDGCFRK